MTGLPPALLAAVRNARHVCVLTGAGVSAESGVPTFRDAMTGLWATFDPSQLATPEAFARDPALVARWYDERRRLRMTTRPNPGHDAIAALERRIVAASGEFLLATQNVDRLHQSAGSERLVELHGSLMAWRCVRCGEEREELGPAFTEFPPRCACGGVRRPGVVWFGEALPEEALRRAMGAAAACDVFLSIGTSSVVYPAAGLIDVALAGRGVVIEINPDETPFSRRATWCIRARSGEAMPALFRATQP